MRDTIFALSTGALPSGIAVIRLSGPRAFDAIAKLAGFVPTIRQAVHATIRNRNDEVIDDVILICFAGPNSVTGEDCAEIQCHGSRAVVAAILGELGIQDGLRPAEAGEFTARALQNGKMDLVAVEGLSDLLRAETEMQRRLAVDETRGAISALYQDWSDQLLRARAIIEAELDFSDEGDVPDSVAGDVDDTITAILSAINGHLARAGQSEIIRDGFRVAIVGPPNAGKSSLLNVLAQRDVAIVSDIAGTTRDVISVDLDLEGYKVCLSDTAGLRTTEDAIEREGVRRSHREMERADLILWLDEKGEDREPVELPSGVDVLQVVTKCDEGGRDAAEQRVSISTVTMDGIDSLVKQILEKVRIRTSGFSGSMPLRDRHVGYLRTAVSSLELALTQQVIEIKSEYLRQAQNDLGRITGSVDVEDLLGVIFSTFCIGK